MPLSPSRNKPHRLTSENFTPRTKSKPSFFKVAAWCSLIASFVALAFMILMFQIYQRPPRWPDDAFLSGSDTVLIGILISITSFASGFASIWWALQHEVKTIFWKALVGAGASFCSGLLALFLGFTGVVNGC